MVLNCEGTLKNPDRKSLYTVDVTGIKQKFLSKDSVLNFNNKDNTLWYVIE